MTHDGSDVATPGRWRLRAGDRRLTRATPVAAVDEADLAYQQMLDNAENRLINARATLDAILSRTTDRRHRDDLLDVYADVIGVKRS